MKNQLVITNLYHRSVQVKNFYRSLDIAMVAVNRMVRERGRQMATLRYLMRGFEQQIAVLRYLQREFEQQGVTMLIDCPTQALPQKEEADNKVLCIKTRRFDLWCPPSNMIKKPRK